MLSRAACFIEVVKVPVKWPPQFYSYRKSGFVLDLYHKAYYVAMVTRHGALHIMIAKWNLKREENL